MNRPALRVVVALLALALLCGRAAAAPPAREREAEAEMLKAKQAMQAGLYEVAVGHLLVARSLVPDASGPYLNLGIAYEQLGRCPDAVPMIEEYLRRKPKSPQASAAATLARCQSATAPRPRADLAPAGTQSPPVAPTPPPTAAAPVQAVPSASPSTPPIASGVHDGTSRAFTAQSPVALSGGDSSAGVPLAWLTLHINPVAADITLDGRRLAGRVRSFERALPGGVYNLSVGARGYSTIARQIRLDPGQQLDDTLTLHKQVWPIVVGVLAGLCGSAAIALTLYYELRPLTTHKPTTQTSGFRFPTGSF